MTKKERMQKRRELWNEFEEGGRNGEPEEVFDNRIIDAFNNGIIDKEEYVDLMNEIAEIRKNNPE